MLKKHQLNYIYLTIFLICLLSRLLFKLISGYDNFELFGDAPRYDMLSERILDGNLNLDLVAFLPAPLYIYFISACKVISPIQWETIVVSLQFLVVSLSSVYVFRLTYLFSKSFGQSVLAALIYIIYPYTLFYNFTISQETLFQSFFIIFLFYLFLFQHNDSIKNLVTASIYFALAWLTKSHITILLPFLAIIIFKNSNILKALLFFFIIFLFTIPHGLINYNLHGVYSFSSYGSNSLLLAGHSDETYPCLTDEYYNHPELKDEVCNLNIIFHEPYMLKEFGNINSLPMKERNRKWGVASIYWIKNNPSKFIELKLNGLKRFILPGLDYRIYSFRNWLISIILGLLIYIPAYYILLQKLKEKFWIHVLSLSIILTIGIIFLCFYPQQRFRIITMEPLLIIYASFFYWKILSKKRRPTV